MDQSELKELLDYKYLQYNNMEFIESDPIQIPHRFTLDRDIEISGFLSAAIAWGLRKSIINNLNRLMNLMDNSPYDFLMNASEEQISKLLGFKHRTFQGEDCFYFIYSLRNIYKNHGGLRQVFEQSYKKDPRIVKVLEDFRNIFFEIQGLNRTKKHISDVTRGATAKRLNMFLRWMVRKDDMGVDFGIWTGIPASALYLPLDVHTGNVGRKLGLLLRKQNDWTAVEEITARLREFDPADPVKYDFALFGLGVYKELKT